MPRLLSKATATGNATGNATADARRQRASLLPGDVLSPTGVATNTEGDLKAFLSTVLMSTGASTMMALVVSASLRSRFPDLFLKEDKAPLAPESSEWFSWVRASLETRLHSDESQKGVIETCGLDQAMLLEFTHLCMKMLAIIGLPSLFILGPMNLLFGGHAAGADRLSYLSMGNVELGSWLYWVTAFVVWAVVLTVKHFVFQAQASFMGYRIEWLENMDPDRAKTVLVEDIPESCQSDEKLLGFFRSLYGDHAVRSAYVAKDTKDLPQLVAKLEDTEARLAHATAQAAHGEGLLVREGLLGPKVEAVPLFARQARDLRRSIRARRAELKAHFHHPGPKGFHCTRGFVTFTERKYAEFSLRLADHLSTSEEQWDIQSPPEARDVLWADMVQDPTGEMGRMLVGYGLIAGLYFLYLPIIIFIANIASKINMGRLQSYWEGLGPTIGVQFMVAYLPTFLSLIFRNFFTMNADAWSQYKLQVSYFWFQVVFVILAAAVGQNAALFTKEVLTSPFSLFTLFEETMPSATHFYMDFLVIQWISHSLNLTRYFLIMKYHFFKSVGYSEQDSYRLAEPEDQDYYGLGSRSARWTINMLIGIIYGTLCPPMYAVCFLNFLMCRIYYGYLIVFAETRKPDLGGVFWVQMLSHILIGTALYCVLMTGVVIQRASSWGPGIIAAPSVAYVLFMLRKFHRVFSWTNLPIDSMCEHHKSPPHAVASLPSWIRRAGTAGAPIPEGDPYVQRELFEPVILEEDVMSPTGRAARRGRR